MNVRLKNPERFQTSITDGKSEVYKATQEAGATCYQPDDEAIAASCSKLNVKNQLFITGHHSTLQHADHYLKFKLNVPVSLATFGLHLHPFYNTSQRSGRYCTRMFSRGDDQVVNYLENFISQYSNEQTQQQKEKVIAWVLKGFDYFRKSIDDVTTIARKALNKERPYYPGNKELQAKRIAQDQLRCVLSTIVPTGMIYTINLTALLALNNVAWNTPLRALTKMMLDTLKHSDFYELKDLDRLEQPEFTPEFENLITPSLSYCSRVIVPFRDTVGDIPSKLLDLYHSDGNKITTDVSQFDPRMNTVELSENNDIRAQFEVPVVTFGQDQRHRTIRRSNPVITGEFNVPKLLTQLPESEAFCKQHISEYFQLCRDISNSEMLHFIPYGAVVRYTKIADLRSYLHNINKRLCWNAEHVIATTELRLLQQLYNTNNPPLDAPCAHSKCPEGNRFCGRDLRNRTREREFI